MKYPPDNSMSEVLDSNIFESLESFPSKPKTLESTHQRQKEEIKQKQTVGEFDEFSISSTPLTSKVFHVPNSNNNDLFGLSSSSPFNSVKRFTALTSSVKKSTSKSKPYNNDFLFALSSTPSKYATSSSKFSEFLLDTPQRQLSSELNLLNQSSILKGSSKSTSKFLIDRGNNNLNGNFMNIEEMNRFMSGEEEEHDDLFKRKDSEVFESSPIKSKFQRIASKEDKELSYALLNLATPKASKQNYSEEVEDSDLTDEQTDDEDEFKQSYNNNNGTLETSISSAAPSVFKNISNVEENESFLPVQKSFHTRSSSHFSLSLNNRSPDLANKTNKNIALDPEFSKLFKTPGKFQNTPTDSPSTIIIDSSVEKCGFQNIIDQNIKSPTPNPRQNFGSINNHSLSLPTMGTFGEQKNRSYPFTVTKNQLSENKSSNPPNKYQFIFAEVKSISSFSKENSTNNLFKSKRSHQRSFSLNNKENVSHVSLKNPANKISKSKIFGTNKKNKGLMEVSLNNSLPVTKSRKRKTVIKSFSVHDYQRRS